MTINRAKWFFVLAASALLGLAIWVFIETADDTPKGEFATWDEPIIHLVQGRADDGQTASVVVTLARGITFLGGTLVLGIVSLASVTWLGLKRRWRAAFVVGSTIAAAYGLTILLKHHFARARPSSVVRFVEENSWSFPSGHSLMSSAVYVILGVLVARQFDRPRFQTAIIASTFFLCFMIGLSRIYLGVHYPTDVLAGWSAGTALAIIGSMILIWWERSPEKTFTEKGSLKVPAHR